MDCKLHLRIKKEEDETTSKGTWRISLYSSTELMTLCLSAASLWMSSLASSCGFCLVSFSFRLSTQADKSLKCFILCQGVFQIQNLLQNCVCSFELTIDTLYMYSYVHMKPLHSGFIEEMRPLWESKINPKNPTSLLIFSSLLLKL